MPRAAAFFFNACTQFDDPGGTQVLYSLEQTPYTFGHSSGRRKKSHTIPHRRSHQSRGRGASSLHFAVDAAVSLLSESRRRRY
ncbi:hypothetical protein MRX96_026977 [Rhipicephalus microplus]